MVLQDDIFETLTELGLTALQAKVYLALTQLGESRAATICKLSKVTRPDIYRVINELLEAGLVEKIVSKPMRFVPIPLQQGLSLLLEMRDQRSSKLKKEIERITKKMTKKTPTAQHTNFRFIEIPNRGPSLKEVVEQKLELQTMDIVTSGARFARWIIDSYKYLRSLLARGVRFRTIVSRSQDADKIAPRKEYLKKLGTLFENPSFQVRYITDEVPALLAMHDSKGVHLNLEPSRYGEGGTGPYMYSDHHGFVGMSRIYFDMLWGKAAEADSKAAETE